ncbi:MAG: glycosyl hydrolase family 28 protein [Anaeroplasma bactoclasticum]|nr:glycosyl hydrolase family 28 protein [Anaeroplasma bactoclasticum]
MFIHNECKISPLQADIPFTIDENRRVITFTITQPGQYTIEFRSKRTLHLFVNEYKQYENYKENANLIYFGAGVHNANNSKYISSDNYIHLKSNQTILIDLGAVLECGFIAANASNFKIVGSGIITGASFERSAKTGSRLIPYDFSNCKNFEIRGITTLDPAGWCYNIYFCKDVELDNIKIISSRSNGDGVSLQSCQDVVCKNSFVRSWDDSLVVKNYPVWNTSSQGTTKNILFNHCVLWTDLAQSMEIGYETIGSVMNNIVFDNIIVIHNYHKAPISIHNGNNAKIKIIKFQNITIEDAYMGLGDGSTYLIDFSTEFSATWSTNHMVTSLGSIDDVLVKNVLVISGIDRPLISLRGCIDTRIGYGNSIHKITNVIFEDVYIYDQTVDKNYSGLSMQYTEGIQFKKVLSKPIGANYILSQNSNQYGTEYVIEEI